MSPSDGIKAIEFTDDVFDRPGFETFDRLNETVTGTDHTDDEALLSAIKNLYAADDVEIPRSTPMTSVNPSSARKTNIVPPADFTR